ncbi:CoA-transferase family III [Colletotrichum higginsianum]|nr:CoA-transferase family III [Colletotrichum higginsianum]
MSGREYSSVAETKRLLDFVLGQVRIPADAEKIARNVRFSAARNLPYFPIPFKETELVAALKAIEGGVAGALAATKYGTAGENRVSVNLEKSTAFLIQAYLATTKRPGEYYHIHGSLEASTTLRMIGLEPFRSDLKDHDAIVQTIESHVKNFTVEELERMNGEKRQAGVPVLKHEDFIRTPHGATNLRLPPWSVDVLEDSTPPTPLPSTPDRRILSGVKVLELCRIIAGPVIGRILAEYGADVLKITGPGLSDVPFFQVDGNMGKRAADLDLKTEDGRRRFEALLAEADVVLDGYRPGALQKLGYGAAALAKLAEERGRGFVYVSENCFGYQGEWRQRPGWQQIADCVSGVAWEQGRFMGLDEPVVPPFPISDYGTGCIGAIAALTGLHNRAVRGGSWHAKASLLQYDLLLFRAGQYPDDVKRELRRLAGDEFLALRHSHSVDQISSTALRAMRRYAPALFGGSSPGVRERWYAKGYGAEIEVVRPVVEMDGVDIGFRRASRPNGSDEASWEFGPEEDHRVGSANGVSKTS